MADQSFTILELRKAVARFNEERDWGQYHNARNLAMALSVEAGELLELFLWSRDDGPQPPVEGRRPHVAHELADVVICLMNLANQLDIDVSEAVVEKLSMNAKKYPIEKARGRMEKSSEL